MSAQSSWRFVGRSLALLALASGSVALVQAAPGQTPPGQNPPAQPVPVQAPPAPAAPADNSRAKFEEATRGMQAVSGLFTFYRNTQEDESKDHTRLLAAIPKGLMNQDLMLSSTISRGGDFGYPIGDGLLVRWVQSGNRLLLLAPDMRLKQVGNEPVLGAVRNTYTDEVLAGFPIIGSDPAGSLLVDLSDMIYSGVTGALVAPQIRRDLSRLVKVKSFPENAVVDVDVASMLNGTSARWTGVTYAFRKLPALGSYQPRLADERVGYFTTVSQDWAAKYTDHENLTRYIHRWNLKKLDPNIELSPPEKPIVFILEKNIPIQFRKYVADGISEWNKAFEKVGITQAIVVEQQTDDNEYANIDPEDARYNFIRWIVTGRGFAMGPSRADPRTGQLLDADIIFDDSMVRSYVQADDILGPRALSSSLGDEVFTFFRENPAFLPAGVELPAEDRELLKPVNATADASVDSHIDMTQIASGMRQCNIGNGLRQQLAMAQIAALASGDKKLPDRLIGGIIKDIVTHEVGHTLGLRHNFKGSAWLSLDEIKKRRDAGDDPTWSSVMDYNAYLYFPGDKIENVRHLTSPTIGPYDYWAIEYGYSTPAAGTNESAHLALIAGKTNTRELAYATDEDVEGFASPDPSANRFDMGSDPVEWAKMRIAMADELLKTIKDWGFKKDEPNYYARSAYSTLVFDRVRYIPFVAREVTGIYESRSRAGDAGAPSAFTLIAPAKQREALKFIGDTIFSESFFNADPDLLNKLGANRWLDWASNPAARTDYPVHAAVLAMQAGTLAALTNGAGLQRVYDSEMKSNADDKFTTAELISTLRDTIWSELDNPATASTDAKPMIGSFRRNLQQQYLQDMLSIAELKPGTSVSPDIQNMIRYSLRELSTKLEKSLAAKDHMDFATRAHLNEAKVKIDRLLNAPYVPTGSGQNVIIMMAGHDAPAAK